jgi:hypothetical protein
MAIMAGNRRCFTQHKEYLRHVKKG